MQRPHNIFVFHCRFLTLQLLFSFLQFYIDANECTVVRFVERFVVVIVIKDTVIAFIFWFVVDTDKMDVIGFFVRPLQHILKVNLHFKLAFFFFFSWNDGTFHLSHVLWQMSRVIIDFYWFNIPTHWNWIHWSRLARRTVTHNLLLQVVLGLMLFEYHTDILEGILGKPYWQLHGAITVYAYLNFFIFLLFVNFMLLVQAFDWFLNFFLILLFVLLSHSLLRLYFLTFLIWIRSQFG